MQLKRPAPVLASFQRIHTAVPPIDLALENDVLLQLKTHQNPVMRPQHPLQSDQHPKIAPQPQKIDLDLSLFESVQSAHQPTRASDLTQIVFDNGIKQQSLQSTVQNRNSKDPASKYSEMGFSKEYIQIAVKSYNQDAKIIEFLLYSQQLAKNPLGAIWAADAFDLYPESVSQGALYCQNASLFVEYGFSKSKIKEALGKTGNDKDLALASLLDM